MIEISGSHFLSPNKKLRLLSIFLAIHTAPASSQQTIGQKTHLSSSMVNNYIKDLKQKGLIYVIGETSKTQQYYLTSEGKVLLRDLLLSFSAEIVNLYGTVKRDIAKILQTFYEEGIRTVVLFGVADTAEVVHVAIKNTQLIVIGAVDTDKAKQGKLFNGFIVQTPEELKKMRPDAIIITSFAKQEEIYVDIKKLIGEEIKIKKLSDL
ncbi:MAG: winged helix-turn-helix transcriptional regulator [Desulfobacterales bacterium]|nr:winged helix-turn-helix transcriptional regulator [Desulfobacterales bacterium]